MHVLPCAARVQISRAFFVIARHTLELCAWQNFTRDWPRNVRPLSQSFPSHVPSAGAE